MWGSSQLRLLLKRIEVPFNEGGLSFPDLSLLLPYIIVLIFGIVPCSCTGAFLEDSCLVPVSNWNSLGSAYARLLAATKKQLCIMA